MTRKHAPKCRRTRVRPRSVRCSSRKVCRLPRGRCFISDPWRRPAIEVDGSRPSPEGVGFSISAFTARSRLRSTEAGSRVTSRNQIDTLTCATQKHGRRGDRRCPALALGERAPDHVVGRGVTPGGIPGCEARCFHAEGCPPVRSDPRKRYGVRNAPGHLSRSRSISAKVPHSAACRARKTTDAPD
jgi:hypothetical protein